MRLRTDLLISTLETQEGLSYVLKDPNNGRFFRLSEPEYAVARELGSGGGAKSSS